MIDKKVKAKVINGIIKLTDWQKIQSVFRGLVRMSNAQNWVLIPHNQIETTAVKNDLIHISQIIAAEYPYFSSQLFELKDQLFVGCGTIDPQIYGQIVAIFKTLINEVNNPTQSIWGLVHPKIEAVSKQLYLNGHYANAAEDAFIEINDRVKKLYKKQNPAAVKIPDGDAVMTIVFSPNSPMLKVCDISTETGMNEQKGFMFMLQGAMAALRNPKAHSNITISKDDSMRRIMYASMLMYKIDGAVAFSEIKE
ncbi:MAG: TIGR02391 family protein [Clostridia bacterium]|nr:TIGR02391 family protein [Clostridia bacterium]